MTTHNEIDEILYDLANFYSKRDFALDGSDYTGFEAAKQALTQYIEAQTAEVEKAYGGCHNCYGKGYATVNGVWSGYDTDTDMGSPGGGVRGGNPNEMKFCTCDRGKQLQAVVETKVLAGRIDELNRMYGESPQSWGSAYAAIENRLATLKKEQTQ